jgi:NAD(P)-dependent dehydrogenase (short-subunit alcohol dehydrogenase family)
MAIGNDFFDLKGKVALITGGNGGIGLGIAKSVASSGANVCILGTNELRNREAVEKLKKYNVKVNSYLCDISNEEEVEETFNLFMEEFGRVDACFSNAGIAGKSLSFLRVKSVDWKRIIDVNLNGSFYILQRCAKHMVARSKKGNLGGRLVVTSSLSAKEGFAGNEHYASTKGALVSMVKSLAVEFARYNITANAIMPGWIETDIIKRQLDNKRFTDAVMPRIPANRWGTPEDIGGIAVYLMSNSSSYHTGDCFVIDGGYSIF